jgi:hypothetical protein
VSELLDLRQEVRQELANRLGKDAPAARLASLFSEIESELADRANRDAAYRAAVERELRSEDEPEMVTVGVDGVISGAGSDERPGEKELTSGSRFVGIRMPRWGPGPRPRSWRPPTAAEASRGVAVGYSAKNFTVYRSVIEGLGPTERFRMDTPGGSFELSRQDFEASFPNIARSPSFERGRYVISGRPPAAADRFLVPEQ